MQSEFQPGVYAARSSMGKAVAVKICKVETDMNTSIEARVHIAMSHEPWIPPLLGRKVLRGEALEALVFPVYPCDLGDVITTNQEVKGDQITSLQMKRLLRNLLQVLQSCHEAGIYHLDLKPENILLSSINIHHADIHLADFGNAVFSQTQMIPKISIRGMTRGRLPPEYRFGGASTINAAKYDVWCFGRLLLDVTNLVQNNQQTWADFIRRALHHNPKERASIRELLAHQWLQTPERSRADTP